MSNEWNTEETIENVDNESNVNDVFKEVEKKPKSRNKSKAVESVKPEAKAPTVDTTRTTNKSRPYVASQNLKARS